MVMSARAPTLESAPALEQKNWTAASVNWNAFTFNASAHRTPTVKARGKRAKRGETPTCQVDGCTANLMVMKEYHQRYRICEYHLRVNSVLKDEQPQRFCQQCGRFHMLDMFDREKRSCRLKLERHNARRRKPTGGPAPREPQRALQLPGSRPESAAALAPLPASSSGEDTAAALRAAADAADGTSALSNTSLDTSRKRSRSSGSGSPSAQRLGRSASYEEVGMGSVSYEEVGLLMDSGTPGLLLPDAASMPAPSKQARGMLGLAGGHLLAPAQAGLVGGCGLPGGCGLLSAADELLGAANDSADAWSPFHQPVPLPFAAGMGGLHDGSPLQHRATLPPVRGLPGALSHLRGESQLTLDTAASEAQASSSGPLRAGFTVIGRGGGGGHQHLHQLAPGPPAPLVGGGSGGASVVKAEDSGGLEELEELGSVGGSADADAAAAGLDLLQFADLRTIPHTYHLHDALHPPPAASLAAPVPDSLLRGFLDPPPPHYPPAAPPLPPMGGGAPASSLEYANALLSGSSLPTLYQSFEQLVSLSLKMYHCMPSELPPQLREHLLDAVTDGLLPEGYIRAGCVHLTVDLFVPRAAPLPPAADVAHRLLRLPDVFWRSRRVLVQQGATLAQLENGKVRQLTAAGQAAADGQPAAARQEAEQPGQEAQGVLPEVALLTPPCVLAASSSRCVALVSGVPAAELQLLCRANGRYLEVKDMEVREWVASKGPQPCLHVAFTLPPVASRTLVRVEAAHRQLQLVSQPQVILVAGSTAIVQEVRQVAAPNLCGVAGQVAADLARVMELEGALQALYNEAAAELGPYVEACPPAPRRQYTPADMGSIVAAARRLLAFCCEVGWVNTFGAVLPVAAIGCQCAAQLLDAVTAASMRGLPLLHLAIMSRKPAMVAFLLDWGSCNGIRWANQPAAPFGLTPLHLAALLPDVPVMAELLTDALPDGHRQWLEAATTDGLSPAHYAATSHHTFRPVTAPTALGGDQPQPAAGGHQRRQQQAATDGQHVAAEAACSPPSVDGAAISCGFASGSATGQATGGPAAGGSSSSCSSSSSSSSRDDEPVAAEVERGSGSAGPYAQKPAPPRDSTAWQLPEEHCALLPHKAGDAGASGKGAYQAAEAGEGSYPEAIDVPLYHAGAKKAAVVQDACGLPSRLLTCRQIVCMLVALNVFMSLFALLLGNRTQQQPAVL